MIQQFATNPASMGAVLQTAATALGGASQITWGSRDVDAAGVADPGRPRDRAGDRTRHRTGGQPPGNGPGAAFVPLPTNWAFRATWRT